MIAGVLLLLSLASAHAQPAAGSYLFTHLAGSLGGAGKVDGTGAGARFALPSGIAVDPLGNLYVTDSGNHTIRKVTPGGIVTTLAGTAGVSGSADGAGSAARFNNPVGIAVDNAGAIYVTDAGNFTIRKITPSGAVTTLAGTAGVSGSGDGAGSAARFANAAGIAVDNAGNVYVTDYSTIRKITPGGTVMTLAGTAGAHGSADGTGAAARFYFPFGVAVDNMGTIYVADLGNLTIRKITPGGTVTTLAGTAGVQGVADGTGSAARFVLPTGLTMDSTGNVYVTDSNNSSTIRKITPSGVVTTLAGMAGAGENVDGAGSTAQFNSPSGIAVDNTGNLFVADTYNNTIRKITPSVLVTTLAGAAIQAGSANGTGSAARFLSPAGIAVDSPGNLYIAEYYNGTIRKITPSGAVTTLAGTAGISGSADGTGSVALFKYPRGIAADTTGNVYVADSGNSTIRKITPNGAVTTFAGTANSSGKADGAGSVAEFFTPSGVAVDNTGNVYVADTGNYTVRKITPNGVVSTLAGTAGFGGDADGTGSAARFVGPRGVAVDSSGNVYVADPSKIRKITPNGVVTTLAGSGAYGRADGAGTAAQFYNPTGVVADGGGNIYVADTDNSTIRKITPNGVVTTLAAVTSGDWAGSDDGLGTDAQFNYPGGVAVDSAGNLYVADTRNNAIRKGQLSGPPVITTQPLGQVVSAGNAVQFSVAASGVPGPTYQWYFNGSIFSGATSNTLSFSSARSTDAGDYTVVVTNELGRVTSSKATLTVSAPSVTPPAPIPAPASGGGGSIEGWFALVFIALGASRGLVTRATRR